MSSPGCVAFPCVIVSMTEKANSLQLDQSSMKRRDFLFTTGLTASGLITGLAHPAQLQAVNAGLRLRWQREIGSQSVVDVRRVARMARSLVAASPLDHGDLAT